MKFFSCSSPNFNDRQGVEAPDMIVIHYTNMDSADAALRRLTDPDSGVSCHYLIDEQGNIHQLVDDAKRAWHAGKSSWQSKDDVNSRSIGIELANRGDEPFAQPQLDALVSLCHHLMYQHKIKPENIVGHSDVAPDRKQDPGAFFPWKKLAARDIGIWPKPVLADYFNTASVVRDEKKLKDLFKKAGYGVDAFGKDIPSLRELVTAFQSKFEPHLFVKNKGGKKVGTPTRHTVAKLRALGKKPGGKGNPYAPEV